MAEVKRDCQGLVRRNRYKRGTGTEAYDAVTGERGTKERIQASPESKTLMHGASDATLKSTERFG